MAFELTKGPMEAQYVSAERLYLTRDGEVVREGDTRADTLLVGAGGTITEALAREHGLLDEPAAAEPAEEPVKAAKPAKAKGKK